MFAVPIADACVLIHVIAELYMKAENNYASAVQEHLLNLSEEKQKIIYANHSRTQFTAADTGVSLPNFV